MVIMCLVQAHWDIVVVENSGIKDLFNNDYTGTIAQSETYIILDSTAPKASITRSNPITTETNRNQVVFNVLFNEPVRNVDVTDFAFSSNSISGTMSFCN